MADRVRAVVVEGGSLLLIHRVSPGKDMYVFPGGGVEANETDRDALERECREEIGADVEIEIGHKIAEFEFNRQIEHFYGVRIVSGELGTGNGPEYQQDGGYTGTFSLVWLDISDLDSFNVQPKIVGDRLKRHSRE